MANLASVTTKEINSHLGMEVVRGTATASGDTYKATKIGNIKAIFASDETTAGVCKTSWSGNIVTVVCTNGDVVNLLIFGD